MTWNVLANSMTWARWKNKINVRTNCCRGTKGGCHPRKVEPETTGSYATGFLRGSLEIAGRKLTEVWNDLFRKDLKHTPVWASTDCAQTAGPTFHWVKSTRRTNKGLGIERDVIFSGKKEKNPIDFLTDWLLSFKVALDALVAYQVVRIWDQSDCKLRAVTKIVGSLTATLHKHESLEFIIIIDSKKLTFPVKA